jgi:hypothetical protein
MVVGRERDAVSALVGLSLPMVFPVSTIVGMDVDIRFSVVQAGP